MFKACDYCRHRKKRCRTTLQSPRCAECDHLDLPCEFSPRMPSLKRRQTSRQVVERLGIGLGRGRATWLDARGGSSGGGGGDKTAVHDGDCQVHIEELSGMIDKALLPRSDNDGDGDGDACEISLAQLYRRNVQPFLPFLPEDDGLLARVVPGDGSILADCVTAACALSFHNKAVVVRPPTAAIEEKLLRQRVLTLDDAAGALLLMPCLHLDRAIVDRVFACVEAEHARSDVAVPVPVPLPVLAGALSCHAWRQLLLITIDAPGPCCRPLQLPADALPRYSASLDKTSFAHHYLQIANLALRFGQQKQQQQQQQQQQQAAAQAGIEADRTTQLAWARLEYDCLLWQIQLPSQFLDLRDELPATAESLVLHSLSNLLLLSLYSHILMTPMATTQQEQQQSPPPPPPATLGNMLALRPVPGVLHFMCALARSVFICPRAIVDRWEIVVDIQAVAAHTMLRLWHDTQFENCRAIMNLWHDDGDRYRVLAQQVREATGPGPWRVDGIDGYSVFWTFRDLRTLTLEMICGAVG